MALYVNIEKKLGNFHLKVEFEAKNNVLALLGASGCGKSMTLKCIAGIETPDKGRIVLDGVTLFDSERRINLVPQKRRVGYLFQQYALFPNMTVWQNIACGVRDARRKDTLVQEAIAAMHLEGMEKKKPHQLSGGQQQRVALARILVNEPEVLLLDEPFSALDSHLRFQLENEVRNTIQRFGKTVLLVSHNRDEVFRLSDHIAVMNQGSIEAIGTKKDVFDDPKTVGGAILTGCKNVVRIEKHSERLAYVPSWGVTLETDKDIADATHLGVRMHDVVLAAQEENSILCDVAEEIENPFSVTVLLKPQGNGQAKIGVELDKNEWNRCRAESVMICLPSEHILLLKE